MIKIDGTTYGIPILSLTRKAEFISKYASRTEDGVLRRELTGVYFNYQLKLGRATDIPEYGRLWKKLTEPVEFHTVTVPDEDGEYTFTAYFDNVGDELRKMRGEQNFWKSLTVNFTAQAPAREAYENQRT